MLNKTLGASVPFIAWQLMVWCLSVMLPIIGTGPVRLGERIALIINYQHPAFYHTIDFLKKIYEPYFPNIIILGHQRADGVCTYEGHPGWRFEYISLARVIQQYPNYDGYLWINDDLIIHPWHFTRFDQKKIWYSPIYPAHIDHGGGSVDHWCWWRTKLGQQAVKKAYALLNDEQRSMIVHNIGPSMVAMGYGDILYLPKHYAKAYTALAEVCLANQVFLEIAMPLIVLALAPCNDWEFFNGRALWLPEERAQVLRNYDINVDYIHPVKISKRACQQKVRKTFLLKRRK